MKYLLVLFTCGAMLSCNPEKRSYATTTYDYEIQGNVIEFTTPTGRACVFVSNGNSGGLSCRW